MIFDTSDFPARWNCGTWSTWLGLLHILSDLAIFVAYVTIPMALIYFTRRRKDLPFSGIFLLFGAFIIFCGITHLMEAIIFYWPAYRLAGFLKLATAIVSIATVIALLPIVPKALLLRTPTQLELVVEERTNELRLANHRLERANKKLDLAREAAVRATQAKSDFLANMSHEIRTPMTAILGFADVLNDEGDQAASRQDAVRTIRRNGEHLLSVLNDILDLSKIEAGKVDLESIPFSPAEVVEDVASLMGAKAHAAGLSLSVEIGKDIPHQIAGDPTRLKQILCNLVGNAVKFTPDGSVRMTVGVEDRPTPDDCLLRFDIIDTGIGMTAEQTKSAFESFGQADTSTTRRFGGTGLGLTISKYLAQALGGELKIVSTEPGVGTHFRLSMPGRVVEWTGTRIEALGQRTNADAKSKIGSIALPQDSSRLLEGIRILVAEDGVDNQRLLRMLLSKAGAKVTIAANGALAIESIEAAKKASLPYDVILMDMQMPEMDGYTATRKLREIGLTTPIVALTAHAMKGDRRKCLKAGCNEYLSKPINRDALCATISALVKSAASAHT